MKLSTKSIINPGDGSIVTKSIVHPSDGSIVTKSIINPGDGSIVYEIVDYIENNEHLLAVNEEFDCKLILTL